MCRQMWEALHKSVGWLSLILGVYTIYQGLEDAVDTPPELIVFYMNVAAALFVAFCVLEAFRLRAEWRKVCVAACAGKGCVWGGGGRRGVEQAGGFSVHGRE